MANWTPCADCPDPKYADCWTCPKAPVNQAGGILAVFAKTTVGDLLAKKGNA